MVLYWFDIVIPIILIVCPVGLFWAIWRVIQDQKRNEEQAKRDWLEYKLVYALYRGALKWDDLSDENKAIVRGEA